MQTRPEKIQRDNFISAPWHIFIYHQPISSQILFCSPSKTFPTLVLCPVAHMILSKWLKLHLKARWDNHRELPAHPKKLLSSYCCLLPCNLEKEGPFLLPKAFSDVLTTISSRTGWHWLIIHPFSYFSSTFPAPWIQPIIPKVSPHLKKKKKDSLLMLHAFSSCHPITLKLYEESLGRL